MVEGYTFSLLAAGAYGTSPILIRAAVEDATGTAAIGTFIAYVGASAMLMATLALPAQRNLMGTINLRYMRLFGGAGFAVFFAQLSYLVNRRLEHITLGVVLGVLVSFTGSALLVTAAAGR